MGVLAWRAQIPLSLAAQVPRGRVAAELGQEYFSKGKNQVTSVIFRLSFSLKTVGDEVIIVVKGLQTYLTGGKVEKYEPTEPIKFGSALGGKGGTG